jgi:acetylornithine deacetylase/succinyl-diaminopimelate desuccinylase-like protein
VLDVVVDTAGIAVHSGRFGGAVVDPSDLLAQGLVRMRSALMGASTPLAPSGPGWRRVTVPDQHIHRAAGCRAVTGAGLHRRIGAGPSMTVLRLSAGSGGTAGAIPTTARATIDLRFPARWQVAPTVSWLTRLLRTASTAPGARTIVRVNSASATVSGIPIPGVMRALDRATCAVFGEPTRLIASGGSLPVAATLRRVFAQSPVLLGLGASFSGAHGPGEYLDVAQWNRCVECLIHLLGAPPGKGNRQGKSSIG